MHYQLEEWMLTSKMKASRARARRIAKYIRVAFFTLAFTLSFMAAGLADSAALSLGLIH